MLESLILTLEKRGVISSADVPVLKDLISHVDTVPGNLVVQRRGSLVTQSIILLEGLFARSRDLNDGDRQITALHVPGDFVDLHSFVLKRLDHDLLALAPSRIALVPHARIHRLTETNPHLTRLLWFLSGIDASIHREWELSLGQRFGTVRAAHLFCEMHARLDVVDQVDAGGFALPMNQAELAQCLGLTVVHTNRVLRELREADLVRFSGGRVAIPDLARLRSFADFDPDYLHLEALPG